MKWKGLVAAIVAATALGASGAGPVDSVDMFMGVKGISNCVMGVQLPRGSANPGPQTPRGGHNGYSEAEPVRGFGQLNVSGIGWARYGQIFLSPQLGFDPSETGHDSPKTDERATPYYYAVTLSRYGIRTELAPTHHGAAYRLTYPDTAAERTLLLDLRHSIPEHIVPEVRGRFLGAEIAEGPDGMLTGWGEYMGGFGSGRPYKVYFALQTDDPAARTAIAEGQYARLDFSRKQVNLGVAVSLRSVENAVDYLRAELADPDVDRLAAEAREAWNGELSKIRVEGGEDPRVFYTGLYHASVMPRDRSGDNPDPELFADHVDDHFCVWDTWRTLYPLQTLINEKFVAKTLNSFINRYEHHGRVTPTFTSSLEWGTKQGGDDVDNVIADAIVKNVGGFDREKAYEIMKHNALAERDPRYTERGYWPGEHEQMSCSYTMEYAYNDDCTARVAAMLGDWAMADSLSRRAMGWTSLFNPNLESLGVRGFIGPRTAGGDWIDIDPAHRYESWVDYFYEGNSWVYTLFAPGAPERLIELCGGPEAMVERLRRGFDAGVIDLANEPGFLAPFLFIHCGRPDLAAEYVDRLRSTGFTLAGGYPDNEDSGAMGSWYVLASLGIFPDAGHDWYYLLPPAFDAAELTRDNGAKIRITASRPSPDARYIGSVTLNGRPLDRAWIRHSELADGAELRFELTADPAAWRPTLAPGTPETRRPAPADRLFRSEAVEAEIGRVKGLLTNPKLAWMFENCFPNTLDTTVDYRLDADGEDDTFVITGDIHAMWLRDSAAQVWPYLRYANTDEKLRRMLRGVIRRQLKSINLDPYANAFNDGPTGSEWASDYTMMLPEVHERKYEIDSLCYPVRLAYEYWRLTGDASVFDSTWLSAVEKILAVFTDQQRKGGDRGPYRFQRRTERPFDTLGNDGWGAPVSGCGLIVSSFRPSDDATILQYLIPSNFFAVNILRKAAEILAEVNGEAALAERCNDLASEVETALREYAVYDHPDFGPVYAFEADGFGNRLLMDDANVPSLLSLPYLGLVEPDDSVYQNTRRLVWSDRNPYFFRGEAGEGIGGPHIGYDMAWPMSLIMRAFTANDDDELRETLEMLLQTDASTGFMHESFDVNDPRRFTRKWFAWQNTLFGELILTLIDRGKLPLLNSLTTRYVP